MRGGDGGGGEGTTRTVVEVWRRLRGWRRAKGLRGMRGSGVAAARLTWQVRECAQPAYLAQASVDRKHGRVNGIAREMRLFTIRSWEKRG